MKQPNIICRHYVVTFIRFIPGKIYIYFPHFFHTHSSCMENIIIWTHTKMRASKNIIWFFWIKEGQKNIELFCILQLFSRNYLPEFSGVHPTILFHLMHIINCYIPLLLTAEIKQLFVMKNIRWKGVEQYVIVKYWLYWK